MLLFSMQKYKRMWILSSTLDEKAPFSFFTVKSQESIGHGRHFPGSLPYLRSAAGTEKSREDRSSYKWQDSIRYASAWRSAAQLRLYDCEVAYTLHTCRTRSLYAKHGTKGCL